jgi:hypothetical protein
MKVYVVIEVEKLSYEFLSVLGVFTTEEMARNFLDKQIRYSEEFRISEVELDYEAPQ